MGGDKKGGSMSAIKAINLLKRISDIFHEGEDNDSPAYYSVIVAEIDDFLLAEVDTFLSEHKELIDNG